MFWSEVQNLIGRQEAQNYEILFGQRKCIFGQTIPVNQKECWNALHLRTEEPHFSHLEIKNKGTN